MTLATFLAACAQGTLQKEPVIVCTAKEYPALFFAALLQRLRAIFQPAPKIISYENSSFSTILAQLSTTFLGQKEFLWLGDISSLEDVSLKKQLLALFVSYQGPHTIMAYVHADDVPTSLSKLVRLDEDVSLADRKKAISFLFPQLSVAVLEDFLKTVRTESLDHLALLAQYAMVVGRNSQQFKEEWLTTIITPETSLFTLSQYFFGRKTDLFWPLWHLLKDQYAAPFWTAYWSEQLWRAHYVIKLYKQNDVTQAKQLSYRLPFSFLQRDWKTISLEELQRAHQFLYSGDHSFKNGGSEFFLEVFYSTFLTKHF